MKAVITSDWHGDWVTEGVPRFGEVAAAAHFSVSRAIELKQKREEVIYIFAGDLAETEGPGMLRSIELAADCANELAVYSIPSFWLTGNHDVIEDGIGTSNLTPLKASQGEVHDRPIVFQQGRERLVTICFLPFTPHSHDYDPDAFVRAAAEEFPHVDLVVGHLMLEGIGPGSETRDMPRGRNVFWPLDAIKACWPQAVLVGGHYHEAQIFRGVHVIGSLARLTRAECGNVTAFPVIDLYGT
jgi:DNA repair exonuclease SbcCD nuclease subunit